MSVRKKDLASVPGFGAFFLPWIRIWDPGSEIIPDNFSESLETVFRAEILKFVGADPDLWSGIFLTQDPGWKTCLEKMNTFFGPYCLGFGSGNSVFTITNSNSVADSLVLEPLPSAFITFWWKNLREYCQFGNKLSGFFYLCSTVYSTLLRLPLLRFHCVGGCWDWTQLRLWRW